VAKPGNAVGSTGNSNANDSGAAVNPVCSAGLRTLSSPRSTFDGFVKVLGGIIATFRLYYEAILLVGDRQQWSGKTYTPTANSYLQLQ
jgi:hypothetical protein